MYEYTYDALGQLLTETLTKNGVTTVVNAMTYDNYGNILTKNGKVYAYGDSVWKDKLTSFDGQSITYDAQGNPVTYLGHALTWEKGRQLKSFDTNSYTYNANGIRTSKIVNGIKHDYILDGTKILRETWGNNVLVPLYDNEDSVCGIIYNGAPYYFIKNLQGDVVSIVDSWGNLVARYTYDAWGKCTGEYNNIGLDISAANDYIVNINPFRYRGYYLDRETGLYYLQSRYYDPVTGRFINGDFAEIVVLQQTRSINPNLYTYCCNNPTNGNDPMGMLDAAGAASLLSASSIFNMYAASLSTAYAQTLTKIGLYVTGALTPKVSAAFWWQPWLIVGIVVAAVAIVIAAVVALYNARVKYLTSDKTLSDVKPKLPTTKPYKLAYLSNKGELFSVGKGMSFVQALAALGVSGAVNSLSRRYEYSKGSSSSAQRTLESKGKNWGIYANSQSYAKALAVVFGASEKPKVHGSGYYGHYHDSKHAFHIWYGGKITYR